MWDTFAGSKREEGKTPSQPALMTETQWKLTCMQLLAAAERQCRSQQDCVCVCACVSFCQ